MHIMLNDCNLQICVVCVVRTFKLWNVAEWKPVDRSSNMWETCPTSHCFARSHIGNCFDKSQAKHKDNQMPMLFIKPNTGPLRKFNFTCRLKCCITIPPQLLCDQTVVCLEYSCFRVSTGVAAKIATNETTPPSLTTGKIRYPTTLSRPKKQVGQTV